MGNKYIFFLAILKSVYVFINQCISMKSNFMFLRPSVGLFAQCCNQFHSWEYFLRHSSHFSFGIPNHTHHFPPYRNTKLTSSAQHGVEPWTSSSLPFGATNAPPFGATNGSVISALLPLWPRTCLHCVTDWFDLFCRLIIMLLRVCHGERRNQRTSTVHVEGGIVICLPCH